MLIKMSKLEKFKSNMSDVVDLILPQGLISLADTDSHFLMAVLDRDFFEALSGSKQSE